MPVTERFGRIEDVAKRHVDAGAFAGIEWKVLRGGQVFAQGGYGDLPDRPIYRIFSMTKPIVSALALMLIEQGKLRLFDPLAAILPEFANMQVLQTDGSLTPADPIITEHLLTHRAGFSYGFLTDCPIGEMYRHLDLMDANRSLADFTSTVSTLPLAFQPGTNWRYSVATDILARAIEAVLDKPIADILRDEILTPIGTTDTGFTVPDSQAHRIMPIFGKSRLDEAMMFDALPQTLIPADMTREHPHDDDNFRRGGMGLFSTIEDYALLASFLNTGLTPDGTRLLSRASIKLMWTDRVPDSQKPLRLGPFTLPGYGFGLAGRVMSDLGASMGLTGLGEAGWAGAASTFFWIDPAEDLIGIVMAQYIGSKIPIGEEFRTAVYQALDD